MYIVFNSIILIAGLAFVVYLLWLVLLRRDSLRKRLPSLLAILGILVLGRIVIDATLF